MFEVEWLGLTSISNRKQVQDIGAKFRCKVAKMAKSKIGILPQKFTQTAKGPRCSRFPLKWSLYILLDTPSQNYLNEYFGALCKLTKIVTTTKSIKTCHTLPPSNLSSCVSLHHSFHKRPFDIS